MTLQPNQKLGRYVIGYRFGSGSFGQVYTILNYPHLVLKIAKLKTAECTQLRNEYLVYKKWEQYCSSQFLNTRTNKCESTDTVLLPHVSLYGEYEGYAIMTLEKLDATVASIPTKVWLGKKEVCQAFGRKMVRGLQCLHQQVGYLHGDLKLENIMYGGDTEHLYMIDFGLAKPLEGHHFHQKGSRMNNESVSASTQLAVFMGSPRYASVKCHERKYMMNEFDDLESLLYILLFMYWGESGIPWVNMINHRPQQQHPDQHKQTETLDNIGREKQKYGLELCQRVNTKWYTLLDYIWKNCRVTNEVDYSLVLDLLQGQF